MGYAASNSDTSFFIWKGSEGPMCILLYVDDLVIIGPDLAAINKVKS